MTFKDLNLNKFLWNALDDIGFETPTAIQELAFSPVMSGRDVVGIAQTGTGKTFAYMLPILRSLVYSKQENPRVLVLVPTRELVVQVVEEIEKLSTYIDVRVAGVYGGVNINRHKELIAAGQDIIVATPGRLYDLSVSRVLKLKSIQKIVIDEVDVMLDLGFRPQLMNIIDMLPARRQHIMFSATMTEDVDALISDFFKDPEKITVAASGTPLDNISQVRYEIPNFYTKVNFLLEVLASAKAFPKVLLFTKDKRMADRLYKLLEEAFPHQSDVIHSNKSQNYRLNSIGRFAIGKVRLLVATDLMARGLDIDDISHVINVDVPTYPENYLHRIGRTGRAERQGIAFVLSTPKEVNAVEELEALMGIKIPVELLPEDIEISKELTPDERPEAKEIFNPHKWNKNDDDAPGPAFHDKSEKNSQVNEGGKYRREIALKYKKPKTRGDKNYNFRNKRK
ncbi:MAG: DEAD/DEAH box helicase [Dokdonia sp.]|nr:DEAD/DEAH box helicase [Dokdonia sp.]